MKKLTILFFVLTFILAACGGTPTASPVVQVAPAPANAVIAEGHLVPARDAALAFQARGTVTEVNVKIGDKVKAGDVLARLGGPNDAAYAAAQAELTAAQQAYNDLLELADVARAQAWLALDQAEGTYNKAQDYYDSLFEPYEFDTIVYHQTVTRSGVKITPSLKHVKVEQADDETIAEAKANLELAKALYEEAQRAYERVKDGPDRDKLALAEARRNAAKAGVAAFEIRAPFDGTVMDVNVSVGKQAGPEMWAVKIADTSAWYVETADLTELEVVKIAAGQKVSILPDALPDAQMTGVVESISQAFTLQAGDVLYRVKIKVDEIDPRLLWGMTVEVTFEPLE